VLGIFRCATVETDLGYNQPSVWWLPGAVLSRQLVTVQSSVKINIVATVRALSVVFTVGAIAPLPLFSNFATKTCKIASTSFVNLHVRPSTCYSFRFAELIRLSLSMPEGMWRGGVRTA
jgi:hypothetical protein